jgi:hypothetical protein
MSKVVKTSLPAEVPGYDKAYWHAKTPLQRLDAALGLILYAKAVYGANPANPPFAYGNREVWAVRPTGGLFTIGIHFYRSDGPATLRPAGVSWS